MGRTLTNLVLKIYKMKNNFNRFAKFGKKVNNSNKDI